MRENLHLVMVVLVFLVWGNKSGFGQASSIPEIKQHLFRAAKDTNAVNQLNDLSIQYLKVDEIDSAYKYASYALQLSTALSFPKGKSLAHNVLANIYYFKGDYSASLTNNLEALNL